MKLFIQQIDSLRRLFMIPAVSFRNAARQYMWAGLLLGMCGAVTVVRFSEDGARFLQATDSVITQQGISVTPVVDVTKKESYAGLPVADVQMHHVENAWGTALYIPQYHKNPSSSAEDSINNSAEVNQREIYAILTWLKQEAGHDLVMVEGKLVGKVPDEDIQQMSERLHKHEQLVADEQSLEQSLQNRGHVSTFATFFTKMTKKIVGSDRNLFLQGAPLVLAAEDGLRLFGLERQATQDESKKIVREYVYLQDRISQLNTANAPARRELSNSVDLQQLMKMFGGSSLNTELSKIENWADTQGYADVAAACKRLAATLQEFEPEAALPQNSSGPSRSENPYNEVTDSRWLKNRFDEVEAELEKVVVEKRNEETAQGVAQTLAQEQEEVGIVQFGAGHTLGLVEELNKQGLDVVVITSNEVARRGIEDVK